MHFEQSQKLINYIIKIEEKTGKIKFNNTLFGKFFS